MHLVVGLGNPGARYAGTRHNVGFLVVDTLARRSMASVDKAELGALTAKVRLGEEPVLLVKPQKYMNLSGGPSQELAHFYKVPADKVVVVHDDLDVPFGDVKVKRGGGHGGHNGLRDLHARLGTADYLRVRVGVGRPPAGWDTADYVLGRWTTDEASGLEDVVQDAADAAEAVVVDGVDEAMNRFNGRRSASA